MIIKVCGMGVPSNVAQVAALDIDWMGFIFYPKSARCVKTPASELPAIRQQRVGVFVNESLDVVREKWIEYHLDIVQLHGAETVSYCESLRAMLPHSARVMKAISVSGAADIDKCDAYAGIVDYLLFDTKCDSRGGSGKQFDWSVLQSYQGTTPFLLSGGIGPEDVDSVQAFVHPRCMGVDVNSRFEVMPGVKDAAKLSKFVERLRNMNQV